MKPDLLRLSLNANRSESRKGGLLQAQIDPYKTPESSGELQEALPERILASKRARFFNFVIDWVMQMILVVLFSVAISLMGSERVIGHFERLPGFVLGFLAMCCYYIPMESIFGRTVGKFITGTKVVNEVGAPPSFAQVVGRTLSRVLPLEALTFLRAETRGLHDSLPETYVTKCR